jgi:hypothetical protein
VRSGRVVACAVAVLMLAGCSGTASASGTHHRDGTVIGRFVREGGPLGPGGKQPPAVPLSGTVRFTRTHGHTVVVHVGSTGRFTVRLRAGRYRVSGSSAAINSAKSPCTPPMSVRVRARRTAHLTVVCPVP